MQGGEVKDLIKAATNIRPEVAPLTRTVLLGAQAVGLLGELKAVFRLGARPWVAPLAPYSTGARKSDSILNAPFVVAAPDEDEMGQCPQEGGGQGRETTQRHGPMGSTYYMPVALGIVPDINRGQRR